LTVFSVLLVSIYGLLGKVQLALQTPAASPQALDSSSLGQAKLCRRGHRQSAFCCCDYGECGFRGWSPRNLVDAMERVTVTATGS